MRSEIAFRSERIAMAVTATFSPDTSVLSLVGDTAGSAPGRLFGAADHERLMWGPGHDRGGAGDAFTVMANGGRVRAFRAFRDQPRSRDERHQRRRRRPVGE
jgi:hypothetical protein